MQEMHSRWISENDAILVKHTFPECSLVITVPQLTHIILFPNLLAELMYTVQEQCLMLLRLSGML